MLVDETHHLIGVCRLRYLDLKFQRAVVVELQRRPLGMVSGGTVAQLPIASVAIGRVGDKRAAVGGGSFRDDKVRTRAGGERQEM